MKPIKKIDMDNGSFPIAKDILRVLAKTTISNSHRAIIDAILDKTYGWIDHNSKKKKRIKQRKTQEFIKYKFFQEYTGMTTSKISKIISDLIKRKIIIRSKHKPFKYSLNCNVSEWDRDVFRKRYKKEGWGQVIQSDKLSDQVITQTGNLELPDQATKIALNPSNKSKIQKPKETISKETKNVPNDYLELSSLLGEKIKENDPGFRFTGLQRLSWADDVRIMVEKDNRPLAEIEDLIIWSQEHLFWRSNILSMGKLREQYTRLKLQKEAVDPSNANKKKIDPYEQSLIEAEIEKQRENPPLREFQ